LNPSRTEPSNHLSGEDLLTVPELCAELNISRNTFQRWRTLRIGPSAIRLPNGSLRFRRAEVQDWLLALEEAA
jgi:predicted DNA-binding transcriptional regulator AlpA